MVKRRIFVSFDHDTQQVNGFLGLRNIILIILNSTIINWIIESIATTQITSSA